jgi:hypothetical protein
MENLTRDLQVNWRRNKMSVKERFQDDFEFEGIKIKQSLYTEPPSCVYDSVT